MRHAALHAATQRKVSVMGGPWVETEKTGERLRRMKP
jgi:hypothetical protein